MNKEVWYEIFKRYIGCFEAIEQLYDSNIIDGEIKDEIRCDLLVNIIETMKSEVEE